MQDPDNQATAQVVSGAEIPEERETSEVSVAPEMSIIPELPPLPSPPSLLEFPTLPNLLQFSEQSVVPEMRTIPELPPHTSPPPTFLVFPTLPNLSPLSPLSEPSPMPRFPANFASTRETNREDAREFPSTSAAEGTAECSQPPNAPQENTFDLLTLRLSAHLQCLLCIEIMMPPIVVCWNGHMICNNCRPKLEKCPLCRDVITTRRNIFAEEICKFLKIRCKYANVGCLTLKHPNKIQEHEDICFFQPVECLAGSGGKRVLKCGWKGKKCDLLAHVNKQHGISMIHATQPEVITSPCVYGQDCMRVTLISAHSELFWLTLKFDVKKNKRFEAVHFIGSAARAKEFRYKCDLSSGNGETGTSFFSTTKSILHETGDVFAASPHFQMDIDVFEKLFVEKDGHIPGYKLTIEKVGQSKT